MIQPIELKNIKSSGIYRYVWDKSIIKNQDKPTLRLLLGYSEKGPFNSPVLINNTAEFIKIYGKINNQLENKGQFFHRCALQALSKGPILTLNLKPFENEKITHISFDCGDLNDNLFNITKRSIFDIYDTNRFWELNIDNLKEKITDNQSKYINIVSTDSESYTVFMRPVKPIEYNGITIQQWYGNSSQEMPDYLEYIKHTQLDNYFMEIFVFKTKFDKNNCGENGIFNKYFKINNDEIQIKTSKYKNSFGEICDALQDLANDPNSLCVGQYTGCTIPNFIDYKGINKSIDYIFNQDNNKHKMLMFFNENKLEDHSTFNILNCLSGIYELIVLVKSAILKNPYVYTDGNEVWVHDDNDSINRVKLYDEGYENPQVYQDDAYVFTYLKDIELYGKNHMSIPVRIEGYEYNTINKNMTGPQIQEKILSVLGPKYSIREALTNRADIEYHYLVDTMDSYIGTGCKSQLASIAKMKGNSLALINFPKIKEFIKNPGFINPYTHAFDLSLILQRKDLFSLPSEVEGAEYAAYFTQMIYSDGTRQKIVPSAALVSNCFVDKYLNKFPFMAVAGRNGIIEGSGIMAPDYNFDRKDRDTLEVLGVNPIVLKNNINNITANKTAKQLPLTALSYINICELIIYIQDEVESILQDYQWELNTGIIRSAITQHCIALCDKAKQNGGLQEFHVICDESNNTPETIDNEMIIVDIEIVPSHCTSKMIQRLTLNKTK